MKLCQISILIAFLIMQIEIGAEKKKLEQKTFDEIFGEKWEQKEEENGNNQNKNEQKKREIIEKFKKIKEKMKQNEKKYSKKEWNKIDSKIAKTLGTNRKYIYEWIKELGLYKCHNKSKTDEQKIECVQKFIAMRNEYKQKGRKYSTKEWDKNYAEIGKKIGVNYGTIQKWKKQFGMCERMTEKEKMEKVKMYFHIKRENPKISDEKIAKILKISQRTVFMWKKRFGEE